MSPFARAVVSMGLLSLLLFFAGIIFSESLHRDCETAGPLSSNLFGSVVEAADFFWQEFQPACAREVYRDEWAALFEVTCR